MCSSPAAMARRLLAAVADGGSRPLDPQRLLARPRHRRQGDRQPRFRRTGGRRAFPRAEARLNIAGFTRTGVATRSPPVDLSLLGTLQPDRRRSRRGDPPRRRASSAGPRLRLQPVGAGGGLDGPADGGAARRRHPLQRPGRSPLVAERPRRRAAFRPDRASAADFSGRLDNPQLNGVVRANNLTFVDEPYGTRITGIALQGRFTSATLQIDQLSGRAGSGTISGQGTIGFAANAGYPIDVRMHDERRPARPQRQSRRDGHRRRTITNNSANGALISGDLTLANLRYQVIRQGAAQIVDL